jgi:hypothetical protein
MVEEKDKPKPTEPTGDDYRKATKMYEKLISISLDFDPRDSHILQYQNFRSAFIDCFAEYIMKERADAVKQTKTDIRDKLEKWLGS